VEASSKENKDFIITYIENKKPIKLFLRANNEKDRDAWVKAIIDSIE